MASNIKGIFGRDFVPLAVAVLAGYILPQLLLLAAAVRAIRRRWALMLGLCAAAAILAVNLVVHYTVITETRAGSGLH